MCAILLTKGERRSAVDIESQVDVHEEEFADGEDSTSSSGHKLHRERFSENTTESYVFPIDCNDDDGSPGVLALGRLLKHMRFHGPLLQSHHNIHSPCPILSTWRSLKLKLPTPLNFSIPAFPDSMSTDLPKPRNTQIWLQSQFQHPKSS